MRCSKAECSTGVFKAVCSTTVHSTTQDHETEPGSQCPGLHVALFGSQSSVATITSQSSVANITPLPLEDATEAVGAGGGVLGAISGLPGRNLSTPSLSLIYRPCTPAATLPEPPPPPPTAPSVPQNCSHPTRWAAVVVALPPHTHTAPQAVCGAFATVPAAIRVRVR